MLGCVSSTKFCITKCTVTNILGYINEKIVKGLTNFRWPVSIIFCSCKIISFWFVEPFLVCLMWYIKLSNKLIKFFFLSFVINHYHWLYIILQWLHDQKIALLWLSLPHTKLAWLIQRRISKTIKPHTVDQRFLRNCKENWDISLILCRTLIKKKTPCDMIMGHHTENGQLRRRTDLSIPTIQRVWSDLCSS